MSCEACVRSLQRHGVLQGNVGPRLRPSSDAGSALALRMAVPRLRQGIVASIRHASSDGELPERVRPGGGRRAPARPAAVLAMRRGPHGMQSNKHAICSRACIAFKFD